MGFGHFISFLPILVRDVGVSEAELPLTVGLLSASVLVFGLPLVPFWGAWADRYSRKLIVVRSAVVEAILFGLLFLATDAWHLFLIAPLAGLVLGNTGVMLSELTERTPRRHLGFAVSLVGTAGPLGFALGPGTGGFLADRFGVQSLFVVDAIATVAVVVLLLVMYHEAPDRRRIETPVLVLVRRSLVAVVRTPLARAVFLSYFLLLLGQRFLLPYLALWVERLNGPQMLATAVGLVAAGYGLAALVGSPLAGLLADRVGYRPVLTLAVLLVTACFVLAAVMPGLASFAIVYALYGAGFATASSMLFAVLAAGLSPDIRSSVLNLALLPLYLSGTVGSLLSAALVTASAGDLRPIWAVSALVVVAALLPIYSPGMRPSGTGRPSDGGPRRTA